MEMNATVNEPETRLPWHKPELQQLVISLDTAFQSGSGADGGTFEFSIVG